MDRLLDPIKAPPGSGFGHAAFAAMAAAVVGGSLLWLLPSTSTTQSAERAFQLFANDRSPGNGAQPVAREVAQLQILNRSEPVTQSDAIGGSAAVVDPNAQDPQRDQPPGDQHQANASNQPHGPSSEPAAIAVPPGPTPNPERTAGRRSPGDEQSTPKTRQPRQPEPSSGGITLADRTAKFATPVPETQAGGAATTQAPAADAPTAPTTSAPAGRRRQEAAPLSPAPDRRQDRAQAPDAAEPARAAQTAETTPPRQSTRRVPGAIFGDPDEDALNARAPEPDADGQNGRAGTASASEPRSTARTPRETAREPAAQTPAPRVQPRDPQEIAREEQRRPAAPRSVDRIPDDAFGDRSAQRRLDREQDGDDGRAGANDRRSTSDRAFDDRGPGQRRFDDRSRHLSERDRAIAEWLERDRQRRFEAREARQSRLEARPRWDNPRSDRDRSSRDWNRDQYGVGTRCQRLADACDDGIAQACRRLDRTCW